MLDIWFFGFRHEWDFFAFMVKSWGGGGVVFISLGGFPWHPTTWINPVAQEGTMIIMLPGRGYNTYVPSGGKSWGF
jgi:hypothetical protein